MHTGLKLTATVTPCDRHSEIWGHVLAYVIENMRPFPLVQTQSQCRRNPPFEILAMPLQDVSLNGPSDNVVSDVNNSLHILIIEHVYSDPE